MTKKELLILWVMMAALFTLGFVQGCSSVQANDTEEIHEVFHGGCYYIVYKESITHKGNCPNLVHQK